MRDILVSIVLIALLPLGFRKPFVGLLIFSLLAYMRLQDLTWGFAKGIRWSFYFAIVTFAGFLVNERGRKFMANDVRCLIMIVLIGLVGGSLMANGGIHKADVGGYTEFIKIVVIALFTTGMVDTRDRLRTIVWVIALSFAFYGFKSGIVGVLSLGQAEILQGPGGMLMDNNDFALALSMGIPMLWHIAQSERSEHLRRILVAGVPLTMLTVMMTRSRGGFLSMSTAVLLLVMRSRNRLAGLAVLLMIAGAGVMLAPAEYKERLGTITSYEEDGSAKARLSAWRTAGRMIADNPLFGVGFGRFEGNYGRYDPSLQDITLHHAGTHVAHNSYLQIWAECGTPTFALYMTLILLSFLDIWRVRRQASRRFHASWILNYCTMFEASLATFMVGSTFLNRAHFDLFYHWVAIILCFSTIARAELRDEQRYPVRSGRRGTLVAVRKPGFEGGAARPGLAPAAFSQGPS